MLFTQHLFVVCLILPYLGKALLPCAEAFILGRKHTFRSGNFANQPHVSLGQFRLGLKRIYLTVSAGPSDFLFLGAINDLTYLLTVLECLKLENSRPVKSREKVLVLNNCGNIS